MAGRSVDNLASNRPAKRLRSQKKLWLLNTTLEELTGSKLPLNLQVLRKFMFIRDEDPNSKTRSTAKIVYDELVSKFWGPSRIPMKSEKKCIDQIVSLFQTYEKLKKTPLNRRKNAENSERIRLFLDEMQSLCDLSDRDVEQKLRQSGNPEWRIDLEFLLGQRKTPQVGSMEGVDKILAMKEKRKEEELKKIESRKQKELKRKSMLVQIEAEIPAALEEDTAMDGLHDQETDSSFEVEEARSSSRSSSTVSLSLPVTKLISDTATVAQRFGVSERVHLFMACAFVKTGTTTFDVYFR